MTRLELFNQLLREKGNSEEHIQATIAIMREHSPFIFHKYAHEELTEEQVAEERVMSERQYEIVHSRTPLENTLSLVAKQMMERERSKNN